MTSTFLTRQRVTMDIRDQNVGVYRQFGLKGVISEHKSEPVERTLKT